MELFERIDLLIEKYGGSRTKFAKRLGIGQTTFNGYFSKERQKNFWEILPSILKEFPFVSRDWLYFGEGEILKADEYAELKRRVGKLERQLLEESGAEAAPGRGFTAQDVDSAER